MRGKAGFCARVTAGPKRPHLGVCLGPNIPLQGRQGSRRGGAVKALTPRARPFCNRQVGELRECVKSESKVAQSCPTLSYPMDCSPPGSSVHGTLQARVLELGAIAFSRDPREGGGRGWAPSSPSVGILQSSRLLPCPGYYKQCCDEHWGTRVSFNSDFLGVHAQQWDRWVVWQFYFQFLSDLKGVKPPLEFGERIRDCSSGHAGKKALISP